MKKLITLISHLRNGKIRKLEFKNGALLFTIESKSYKDNCGFDWWDEYFYKININTFDYSICSNN